MLILAGMIVGAAGGMLVARRRGGARLDQLQYALAYAIACGLLALFADIALGWSLFEPRLAGS